METDNLLDQVADIKADVAFVTEYKTPDTLEQRRIEGLGMAISQWTKWTGYTILQIFRAALEDANCRAEVEAVDRWIRAMEEGITNGRI